MHSAAQVTQNSYHGSLSRALRPIPLLRQMQRQTHTRRIVCSGDALSSFNYMTEIACTTDEDNIPFLGQTSLAGWWGTYNAAEE